MYSGAQISLYPMTDNFVPLILSSLSSLDPYRPHLRIETDDLSTLFVGPPQYLFAAMHDLLVEVAKSGVHVCLHATISRGCPGEEDGPTCDRTDPAHSTPVSDANAQAAVDGTAPSGQTIAAQFAYYPLGQNPLYMKEIYAAIDFIRSSGTFTNIKNFVTRLDGDAAKVFKVLERVFVGFAPEEAHVTLDLTVSANSPSKKAE